MSNIISWAWSALKKFFRNVKNIVVSIVRGLLQFTRDVVNWFRNLTLDPETQTPFITDAARLRDMIHEAPKVDVGIFSGVYNEETDEIEYYKEISADALDSKTVDVLANATDDNPIVVLN